MSALRHDPLTYRYPRTLRETRPDPMDWWTTAEAAAAEEEHIRAMFAEPPRRQRAKPATRTTAPRHAPGSERHPLEVRSVESEHPWLWLLYGVAVLVGIVGSALSFGGAS